MLLLTPSVIGLADAVALLQLVNGLGQLFTLVRGHGVASSASAPADATAQLSQVALTLP